MGKVKENKARLRQYMKTVMKIIRHHQIVHCKNNILYPQIHHFLFLQISHFLVLVGDLNFKIIPIIISTKMVGLQTI